MTDAGYGSHGQQLARHVHLVCLIALMSALVGGSEGLPGAALTFFYEGRECSKLRELSPALRQSQALWPCTTRLNDDRCCDWAEKPDQSA
jgi:hypothetical protein